MTSDALQTIEDNINNKVYANEINAMIATAHYALDAITLTELNTVLALMTWTYDSTAHTLSDGTTTYTVNTLISNAIDGQYDKKPEIGKWLMTQIIAKAQTNSLITSDEATTLKAKLEL
jgi:hypothetical protein